MRRRLIAKLVAVLSRCPCCGTTVICDAVLLVVRQSFEENPNIPRHSLLVAGCVSQSSSRWPAPRGAADAGTGTFDARMEKVTGRSDDMIIVRGINVFPTQIEEQVLRCDGLGPRREDRLDSIRLLVEQRSGHTDPAAREALGKLLAANVRNAVGLGVEVTVGEPGNIEPSAGKVRRIVDLRPKS
jgi:AMP-binding enzyme C-terminal domain